MTKEDRELLENEWKNIESRVVLPLWNAGYKTMYESLKLDYDDFVSLAGYELIRAISSFDNSKSNLYTFATNVIKRKANTELRNYGNRDKRKSLYIATSLNTPVSDDDNTELGETIRDEGRNEEFVSIEETFSQDVQSYFSTLTKKQQKIGLLLAQGYSPVDIQKVLGITSKKYQEQWAKMTSLRKTSILCQER